MRFNGFSFSFFLFPFRMALGWGRGGWLCWRATRRGITSWRLIGTMSRGAALGSLPPTASFYIGLIDLLMPEKTHLCSCGICFRFLSLNFAFELCGRAIAQRRMQTAPIVVPLDENFDVLAQMRQVTVVIRVNLLPF